MTVVHFEVVLSYSHHERKTTLEVSPVYVLPGIYGVKSELAEFQSRLLNRVPVEIIELQDLEEPFADLVNMKAIGAAVARDIDQRSPKGSLRLAGYSFGGSVAFEAAQHLISARRSVCFLGLIDVRPPSLEHIAKARSWGTPMRLLRKIRGSRQDMAYRVLRELLGRFFSSDSRRHHVLSMVKRFWPSREEFVRRALLFYCRRRAMAAWRPSAIRGTVFLAISQENLYSLDQWKRLCPESNVVMLPGEHLHVLKSPSFEVLSSAFESAARNSVFYVPLLWS
jgi:acetoacetyl-CoA synthetase